MQSHLGIGRIILAVSICVFNIVECSSCPSGRPIKGYCLKQDTPEGKDKIADALNSLHCNNLTDNQNYHPCDFSSSQSCAIIFHEDEEKWSAGCVANDHGYFIQYSMQSKQLETPIKAKYLRERSVGSFCANRPKNHDCGKTSINDGITDTTFNADTIVCCCDTPACTNRYLRRWNEGKNSLKVRDDMYSWGIVVALGVVQAVMTAIVLITLIHDYYSRYKKRVVIGEVEKNK